MDGQPLISVIVPIYNVAPYLRKCLDSLKGQMLKNIEVICIDDGSTDESGRIADEYATDPRFRIIHTANRGLSAARNRGIEEAKADWLMFVDSDDWVEPEFCRIPYEAAVENGADLVIFQADWWKNGRQKKSKKREMPVGLIDEFTAHEYGSTVTWNKLYTKSLYENIRYPEGHVYEDYLTIYKVVHKAKRIISLEACLYHYVSRRGSITHTRTEANQKDRFVSMCERRNYLNQDGYPVEKLDSLLVGAAIGYLLVASSHDETAYMQAKAVVNSSKGIPAILTWKQKVGVFVWKINPKLFCLLSDIRQR